MTSPSFFGLSLSCIRPAASRTALLFGGALLVATSTGCSNTVYSPPARMLPLETAATLHRGDIGVQAEGGPSGAVLGFGAFSGTARVRRGMTDKLDASLEGSVVRITGNAATDVNKTIIASRIGAKYRLHEFVAVTGGVGGGGSAGGGFVSPDLGVIVAAENPYVVPFVSFRGSVSQPIGAKAVDVTARGEAPGTDVGIPRTTWLANGTLGLRVPIGKWSILGGVGVSQLADAHDGQRFVSAAGGLEAVF